MTPKELRETRKSLGMSQESLAAACGLGSGRTIRSYENGERKLSKSIIILVGYIKKYGVLSE